MGILSWLLPGWDDSENKCNGCMYYKKRGRLVIYSEGSSDKYSVCTNPDVVNRRNAGELKYINGEIYFREKASESQKDCWDNDRIEGQYYEYNSYEKPDRYYNVTTVD